MAQLTIEIPDALLGDLEQVRSELPSLLSQWILASRATSDDSNQTASQEVLSFLLTQPTPQDIFNFKVSGVALNRLRTLLDRNKNDNLSDDESVELDSYEQLDQLMQMLKVRAYAIIKQQSAT